MARLGARALIGGIAAAVAVAAAVAPSPASAASGPGWGSASTAKIRPGVAVTIAGISCVAGFFFTDGTRAFISVPTACAGVSQGQPEDECSAAQVPTGTTAKITGARYPGKVAYSSATIMQLRGTTNANRCNANSLVLIRLDRRDIKRANPSVLGAGGPTGVAWTSPGQMAALTISLAGARTQGTLLQDGSGGWAHTISVSAPAGAAQLGSPVLTASGRAIGLLTLVQQSMSPPSTVSDLGHEIRFMNTVRGFTNVHLAHGSTKFVAA